MLHIIIKDLKLFINDKKGLFMYFLLPIALITIFVLAYSNMGGNYDPIKLVIVDEDQSYEIKSLVLEIDSVSSLNIIKTSRDSAEQYVKSGKITAALFIYNNALDSILNNKTAFKLLYDKSYKFECEIIRQIIIPKISRFSAKCKIKKQLSDSFSPDKSTINEIIGKSVDNQAQSSQAELTNIITYQSISGSNMSEQIGLVQGIAGTAVLMLLFGVRSIGSQIIEEKEDNTFLRTMFSTISTDSYLVGKLISSLLVALAQLTIMFIFSAIVFNFNLFYNFPALLLITFFTALSCASFSILIGVVVTSRAQLQNISTIVILTMSAIGGSMVPLFIMPAIMKKIAVASINYWSIQGFYDIYLRDYNLLEIMPRIYAMASISIICLILSWFYFKKRYSKLLTH